MSILKVARMGHPLLRAKARPLAPDEIRSDRTQKLIDDMIETMHDCRGVGLAAPQVHEGVRLFVAGLVEEHEDDEATDDGRMPVVAVANPQISPVGRETFEEWEGCLSIPGIRGVVPRPRRIRIRGLDREGKRMEIELEDYAARVFQHEADHLDGVLFLDRMRSLQSLTFLEEYGKHRGAEPRSVSE
jgi:peptide deformylase